MKPKSKIPPDKQKRMEDLLEACKRPLTYSSYAGCQDCSWNDSWSAVDNDKHPNRTNRNAREHHIDTGHTTYVEESRHIRFASPSTPK